MKAIFPALALALLAAPVVAQDAPAEAATIAAAIRLADLLVPPAEAENNIETQIDAMRSGARFRQQLARDPRLAAELAKNRPDVEAGIQRIGNLQADTLGPIMRDMQENARRERIRQLGTKFTIAEMQQISDFYVTAAGQKFLKLQNDITRDIGHTNAEKYRERLTDAEKTMAPRVQAELRQLFPKIAPRR